jgi:hypothetical protein
MNSGLALKCLLQDIDEGNTTSFFLHLANANLGPEMIKEYTALMVEAEAVRSNTTADIVDASTKGIEGSGSAERQDAANLNKLAGLFRRL